MRPAGETKGPTARRPFSWGPRALFVLLVALAAPAMFAFAWQHGIATVGDDSVSYLVLARHFAPGPDPLVEPWVAWRATFPPLFPLVLAWTGASRNLLLAHLVVAAFALLALYPLWRLAARELGSEAGGVAVAALFLLTPNAWIGMKGILSEPMFLFVSLATLLHYSRRLAPGRGSRGAWLAFGVLLACCYLTRAAGGALVVAFAVHALLRWRAAPRRALWPVVLALAPVAVLVGLWLVLRPAGHADIYRTTGGRLAHAWLQEPLLNARYAAHIFLDGWVSSFVAQSAVGALPKFLLAAFGVLALAGAARKAFRNRLDGWYVLASATITFFWVFSEENTRRLLYPLVPLAILQTAELLLAACRRFGLRRYRAAVLLLAAALPGAACLPADVVLAEKAQERSPVMPYSHYAYADIVDFYTTINFGNARAEAAHTLAVLAGLESLSHATPPGARIMWMRPEYIAVLGDREGVPFYFAWDARRLEREILRSHVDYVVLSWVYKADMDSVEGDPVPLLSGIGAYSSLVVRFDNAAIGGPAFLLVKVDRARLEAIVRAQARPGAQPRG